MTRRGPRRSSSPSPSTRCHLDSVPRVGGLLKKGPAPTTNLSVDDVLASIALLGGVDLVMRVADGFRRAAASCQVAT